MAANFLLRAWHCLLMNLTNLYAVPAFIIWCGILRPLLYLRPDWYFAAEGVLYSGLLHFISFWVWYCGFSVSEAGDDITGCVDSECLVLVNHQSTGDVLTMVQVLTGAARRRLSQHVCWILDDMFKYTHFGAVCKLHGDVFILQGRDTRDAELARLGSHMRNVFVKRDRTWIVLFPEGGFFRNRKESSQQYGRKHYLPQLEHCTLPRAGAVRMILDVLSSDGEKKLVPETFHRTPKNSSISKHLKYIIDVTIGYPNGNPYGLPDVVFGSREGCKTTVHYRVYPVSSVPQDEESLLRWMYSRYAEKDVLLDRFYRTGSFLEKPSENGTHKMNSNGVLHSERTLSWNMQWCWMIHLFYISSTAAFMYIAFQLVLLLATCLF